MNSWEFFDMNLQIFKKFSQDSSEFLFDYNELPFSILLKFWFHEKN